MTISHVYTYMGEEATDNQSDEMQDLVMHVNVCQASHITAWLGDLDLYQIKSWMLYVSCRPYSAIGFREHCPAFAVLHLLSALGLL